MTLEQQLIKHLRNTSYEDIPEVAIDAARREVLCALGVSAAGAGAEGSEKIIDYVRQQGGRQMSTVIGFGDRLPAGLAGLANGAFGKALEYEDKFWMDDSHGFAIGPAVVPAAFAVAESLGAVDGKSLLTAIALATDIEIRMIEAAPATLSTGWNPTYLFAAFGAAMASAKLMRCNEEECINAVGLAFSQTTGSLQGNYEGVLGIRLQMGFAVRAGITAAEMARLGLTGVHQFLMGRHGLYPLWYRDQRLNLDALTDRLGGSFQGTRLGFKAYPCGAVVHPVLDAVRSLMSKEKIDPQSIETLAIFGNRKLTLMVEPKELRQNPVNHVDCEFSLPWAVAGVAIEGRLALSHFTEEALRNPAYRQMARKVETQMDDERKGVFVEAILKNGTRLRSDTITAAKGHQDNPLSMPEMIEKYRECVQFGPRPVARERSERALDMILELESVKDVSGVVKLLS